MQVNGYYNSTYSPAAAAGPAPLPNAYYAPAATPASNPALDPDQYLKLFGAITPLTAGVAPGFKVARRVHAAKALTLKSRGRMSALRLPAGASPTSALMGGMWSAVKTSLLFKGVSSLVLNGLKVYQNKETVADAGANVVGDAISAGVAGAAAGLASGAFSMLFTAPGLMVTVMATLVGAAGFFVVDNLLRETTVYNNIKASVHGFLATRF